MAVGGWWMAGDGWRVAGGGWRVGLQVGRQSSVQCAYSLTHTRYLDGTRTPNLCFPTCRVTLRVMDCWNPGILFKMDSDSASTLSSMNVASSPLQG